MGIGMSEYESNFALDGANLSDSNRKIRKANYKNFTNNYKDYGTYAATNPNTGGYSVALNAYEAKPYGLAEGVYSADQLNKAGNSKIPSKLFTGETNASLTNGPVQQTFQDTMSPWDQMQAAQNRINTENAQNDLIKTQAQKQEATKFLMDKELKNSGPSGFEMGSGGEVVSYGNSGMEGAQDKYLSSLVMDPSKTAGSMIDTNGLTNQLNASYDAMGQDYTGSYDKGLYGQLGVSEQDYFDMGGRQRLALDEQYDRADIGSVQNNIAKIKNADGTQGLATTGDSSKSWLQENADGVAAAASIGQLGLGLAQYFDQRDAMKAQSGLLKQQLADARELAVNRNKRNTSLAGIKLT